MPTDGQSDLHKHASGDEHSARGFHYECALRCLWLLNLRGTEDRLSIADGEDARITQAGGRLTYRQAKKKEGRAWTYGEVLPFVERAFERFKENRFVRH